MKKALGISGIVAGLGLVTSIIFVVLAGLEYRGQEESGLEPSYTAPGIVLGMEIGFWAFALGLLGFVIVGAIAVVRFAKNRNNTLLALSGIVTGLGFVTFVTVLAGSGLFFRQYNEAAASQISLGLQIGLWISCLGILGFALAGVIALLRRGSSESGGSGTRTSAS